MLIHRVLVVVLIVIFLHTGMNNSAHVGDEILGLSWSPTGDYVAIMTFNTVELLNPNSLEIVDSLVLPKSTTLTSMAWDKLGMNLAIAHEFGEISIWNIVENTHEIFVYYGEGHTRQITKIVWEPSDLLAVSYYTESSDRPRIDIFDLSSRTLVKLSTDFSFEPTRPDSIATAWDIAWDRTGTQLAIPSESKLIILNPTDDLVSFFDGSEFGYQLVEWSNDNARLALSTGSNVRVVNAENLDLINLITNESGLRLLSWNPKHSLLAIGLDSGTLQLWDTMNLELIATYESDFKAFNVFPFAWSPDGSQLAYSESGTIKIIPAPSVTRYPTTVPVRELTLTPEATDEP